MAFEKKYELKLTKSQMETTLIQLEHDEDVILAAKVKQGEQKIAYYKELLKIVQNLDQETQEPVKKGKKGRPSKQVEEEDEIEESEQVEDDDDVTEEQEYFPNRNIPETEDLMSRSL